MDEVLSNFAFIFILRRYTEEKVALQRALERAEEKAEEEMEMAR
jgi:hypothetical protein